MAGLAQTLFPIASPVDEEGARWYELYRGKDHGNVKPFPRCVVQLWRSPVPSASLCYVPISRNCSSLSKRECTGKDKHQGKVNTCLAQALAHREMNHEVMYRYLFTPPLLIDRHRALTTVAEHNTLRTAAFTQAQKWEPFPLIAALHTSELQFLQSQLLRQIPATTSMG